MDKNINVHIKDRVAVAEGDPVIICGNSDYTITFSFDEEWGETPIKTARFKFNTAEGPEHIDQPFEGDTVAVPELSNVREVEVGVFVGDLNTTTGAPIRCKPCIRCGSGAPKDPTPDVYDTIMKLLNLPNSNKGRAVYLADALPENPQEDEAVILVTPQAIPWDKVKIWKRDEIDFSNVTELIEVLPPVGDFKSGEFSEEFNFGNYDPSKLSICGFFFVGDELSMQVAVTNLFNGGNGPLTLQIIVDLEGGATKGYLYDEENGWHKREEDALIKLSPQDIQIPELKNVRVLDILCTIDDFSLEQLGEFVVLEDLGHKLLEYLGAIFRETGIYSAEMHGDSIQWELIKSFEESAKTDDNSEALEKELEQITQSLKDVNSRVDSFGISLSEARSTASLAVDRSDNALTTANGAYQHSLVMQDMILEDREKHENLVERVDQISQAMEGYSEFLEEINGEVVTDE